MQGRGRGRGRGPTRAALTRELLSNVSQGQRTRTVLEGTNKCYISKCRVLTRILDSIQDLREDALEIDENGVALEHIGEAHGLLRLKLPITVDTARLLFAAISIDETLTKTRGRRVAAVDEAAEIEGNNELGDEDGAVDAAAVSVAEDSVNLNSDPASNLHTVAAQTYVNYNSALKWWHEHHDPVGKEKNGHPYPIDVDAAIKEQIRAYKRDVGGKKRRGIMPQREGKSPYNLAGYIAMCEFFNKLMPEQHRSTWMEGIFSQLFTKLSVSTIGRSDNIDDLQYNPNFNVVYNFCSLINNLRASIVTLF